MGSEPNSLLLMIDTDAMEGPLHWKSPIVKFYVNLWEDLNTELLIT